MTITQTSRRLALVAVAALVVALLPLGVASAQDTDGNTVLSLQGTTNVEYSVAWSQVAYPEVDNEDDDDTNDGPARVLVGRDDVFADNLASGALQDDSVLLLTPGDALSELTAFEIERLGADDVTILGGVDAVSEDVEDELNELVEGEVTRLGGDTRIETAIAIAEENGSSTAVLARGFGGDDETQAFADSLAAGGWAAEDDANILLTQTEVLTGNTAAHIEEAGYDTVIIVGGTSAVSQDVEDAVSEMVDDVQRVEGETRFETAVASANARGSDSAADAEGTILVDGQGANAWADGFSAAHVSGQGNPIVLANSASDSLPEPTIAFLAGDAAEFAQDEDNIVGYCGSTVPSEVEDAEGEFAQDVADQCGEFAEALDATVTPVELMTGEEPPPPAGNQAFDVTPQEAAVNIVSEAAGVNVNRGSRTYTVSGLDDATTYRIELIPTDEVTTGEDGNVSFGDNEGTANQADDLGNTAARVETVNGAATDNADSQSAQPSNGTLTFTVDSETANVSVVPVVYVDSDNDGELDLTVPETANNQPKLPTEPFGIGGSKQWVPAEAQSGEFSVDATVDAEDVEITNDDLDFFVADPDSGPDEAPTDLGFRTYYYDSNDSFRVNGAPVTMEAFETQLSRGDGFLTSTYAADEALVSTFNLNDTDPAPLTVASSDVTPTSVELDLTGVTAGATVKVYGGAAATDASMTRANAPLLVTTTTDADTTEAGFQVNITDLSPNTRYEFWATQTVDGDESSLAPATDTGLVVNTGAAPSPISVASAISDGPGAGNQANILDAGDTFSFQFDRAITVADSASLTLIDDDGTAATVTCGSNATCTVSGTNSNILNVAMTFGPSTQNIGGTAGLAFDTAGADFLEVRTASGIGNSVAGWNLAGSGEVLPNRTRVLAGTNADLPAAPDTTEVVPDAASDTVTLTDVTADQAQAGDVFNVYDAQGRLLGSATVTGPAPTMASVATNRDLVAGETLFYTITDSSAGGAATAPISLESASSTEAAV